LVFIHLWMFSVFNLCFFPLILSFHFLVFHSSLDVFTLCVCFFPFFFFCFLICIHPWMLAP
jgi:hypothetical protein